MKTKTASIVGLGLWVATLAAADRDSFYRCVDPQGQVAYQDQPCPPAHQEDQRHILHTPEPPPATALPKPPAAVAAPPAADRPTPVPPPSEPPPALWRCVNFEGDVRYASDDSPRGRWVPAWVVGVDPRGRAGLAGRAGQPRLSAAPREHVELSPPGPPIRDDARALGPMVYVEDRCRQLTDFAACAVYREQLQQAKHTLYSRTGDEARELEAEIGRLTPIVQRRCSG